MVCGNLIASFTLQLASTGVPSTAGLNGRVNMAIVRALRLPITCHRNLTGRVMEQFCEHARYIASSVCILVNVDDEVEI